MWSLNVCLLRSSFKVDRCAIQLAKYYFLSMRMLLNLILPLSINFLSSQTSSSFLPLSINFLSSQQKLLCHQSPVCGPFSSLSLSPPTAPVSSALPVTHLTAFSAHLDLSLLTFSWERANHPKRKHPFSKYLQLSLCGGGYTRDRDDPRLVA